MGAQALCSHVLRQGHVWSDQVVAADEHSGQTWLPQCVPCFMALSLTRTNRGKERHLQCSVDRSSPSLGQGVLGGGHVGESVCFFRGGGGAPLDFSPLTKVPQATVWAHRLCFSVGGG